MGGTGGGAETVQAYLREARRESARRERRRLERRLVRACLRGATVVADPQQERWPFPCARWCSRCGWLRFPAEDDRGSPHRRLELGGEIPCRMCGAQEWIDLGHRSFALALAQSDAFDDRTARAGRWRARAGLAAAALGVAGLAWLGATALGTPSPPAALAIASMGAATVTGHLLRRGWTPRTRVLPRRWSMIPADADAALVVARGPITLDDPLVAPLSGRPCAAYELAARDDDRPEAALGSWTLVEQRNAALDVAGHAVARDAAHLRLPRRHLDDETLLALDDSHRRHLRARGLEPFDSSLVVFESILELEGVAVLAHAPDGTAVLGPDATPQSRR